MHGARAEIKGMRELVRFGWTLAIHRYIVSLSCISKNKKPKLHLAEILCVAG